MSAGIINYFSDHLFFSLFLQGCFFTICLLLGVLYFTHRLHSLADIVAKKESNHLGKLLDSISGIFSESFRFFNLRYLFNKDTPVNESNINSKKDKIKPTLTESFYGKMPPVITFLLSLSIIFIVIFASGILTNRVADSLMDKSPVWHLGLKTSWLDLDSVQKFESSNKNLEKDYIIGANKTNQDYLSSVFDKTDKALKYQLFYKLYPQLGYLNEHTKYEIYYCIKNKLIADDKRENYLNSTQQLINYSQVLVFSFLVLFYFILCTFFINILAVFYRNKNIASVKRRYAFLFLSFAVTVYWACFLVINPHNPYGWALAIICPGIILLCQYVTGLKKCTRLFVNFTLLFITILCYTAAGVCWRDNECEFDAKVYGLYKILEPEIFENELDFLKDANVVKFNKEVSDLKNALVIDSLKLRKISLEKLLKREADSLASH